MTKSNYLFFILILLLSPFTDIKAQNTLLISDIELINLGDGQLSGKKRDENKTPIDGEFRIISGYSNEYIDSKFINGLASGKWSFYSNGNLLQTILYENGYEQGEKITYYTDGKTVKDRTPLNKGKLNGIYVSYYPNGNKEIEKAKQNGVDEGPERRYANNGDIISETVYKNGKAEGKSFDKINIGNDDCYEIVRFYKEGITNGIYSEKFCNGNVKTKGEYINGNKNGTWEYFKKDGSHKKPTEVYNNGDLIKKISFYNNDKIASEENYRNNQLNGTTKKYDDKGNLTSEKNYLNGKLVGKQTQYMFSNRDNFIIYSNYSAKNKLDGDYTELYTDNKKTKVKGQYKEGLKAGKWLYYNTNGELEKEELYENGSLK